MEDHVRYLIKLSARAEIQPYHPARSEAWTMAELPSLLHALNHMILGLSMTMQSAKFSISQIEKFTRVSEHQLRANHG